MNHSLYIEFINESSDVRICGRATLCRTLTVVIRSGWHDCCGYSERAQLHHYATVNIRQGGWIVVYPSLVANLIHGFSNFIHDAVLLYCTYTTTDNGVELITCW